MQVGKPNQLVPHGHVQVHLTLPAVCTLSHQHCPAHAGWERIVPPAITAVDTQIARHNPMILLRVIIIDLHLADCCLLGCGLSSLIPQGTARGTACQYSP